MTENPLFTPGVLFEIVPPVAEERIASATVGALVDQQLDAEADTAHSGSARELAAKRRAAAASSGIVGRAAHDPNLIEG